MQEEILKLINELEMKASGLWKYEEKINVWYVVAELRRILQHSGTTIEVATIKEPSTLKKEYDKLHKDYIDALEQMNALYDREVKRLRD